MYFSRRWPTPCVAVATLLLFVLVLGALPAALASGGARALQEALRATGSVGTPAAVERRRLDDVYEIAEPVWFTPDGVARAAFGVALAQLGEAAQQGLDPHDYDVSMPARLARDALAGGASVGDLGRADVAMTHAYLRFLADLRDGRVAPREVEPHYRAPPRTASFVAELRDAVASDRLPALVAANEPGLALYGRLKALLAAYRRMDRPWPALPVPRHKVVAGDAYAGTPLLHARLAVLGDLQEGDAAPADLVYGAALAEGVRRFQQRHGLADDGVLGKATIAALDVPPGARVRQIELSMERLRWVPRVEAGPLVAINIPSFQLWAFADASRAEPATVAMPVVVGRAARTETPVFLGQMRHVEFSPYWNVPPRILRNEYLGRLARDPALLAREDMELVPARGAGRPITSLDAAALAALADGTLRLRQRPGPNNALGGVKFVLPNTMDIYLHGTPARALFERTRRDFSHGCVRVRDPAALAAFALRGKPEWTSSAIDQAMRAGATRMVPLPAPIPVIVFYTTALADAEGRGHFLADVYGHDVTLERALQRARPVAR